MRTRREIKQEHYNFLSGGMTGVRTGAEIRETIILETLLDIRDGINELVARKQPTKAISSRQRYCVRCGGSGFDTDYTTAGDKLIPVSVPCPDCQLKEKTNE